MDSTAYLLIAPKSVYDDAYHCITVDWEPPQSPQLSSAVRDFVRIKIAAPQWQPDAIGTLFDDSTRVVVRRQLLHDVLISEIETLRYYADSFA
ncbi:hypothetical protein, conserved [Leishmania lindenbergi]|uniref:Uncharacterized protein n=1 Tax=Leishmania lindenbergi TaxID=651832 RepID=A0AAW2ZSP3_9TRYP